MVSSLPGFGAVRTPSRFFFVASLAAAILAAFGLAAILTRAATSRIQSLVFALAFVGTLAESWSAPLPLRRYPTHAEAPPVYHWLAAEPGPRRAIVELPISRRLERHSMHFANIHKRPTVNGVSSFNLPSVYWVSHESFRTREAVLPTQIRANGERAAPRVGKLPPLAPGSAAPVTLNIDVSTTAIELEIRSQGSNAPECTHAVAVPGGPRAAGGDLNKPAPAPAPPR